MKSSTTININIHFSAAYGELEEFQTAVIKYSVILLKVRLTILISVISQYLRFPLFLKTITKTNKPQ